MESKDEIRESVAEGAKDVSLSVDVQEGEASSDIAAGIVKASRGADIQGSLARSQERDERPIPSGLREGLQAHAQKLGVDIPENATPEEATRIVESGLRAVQERNELSQAKDTLLEARQVLTDRQQEDTLEDAFARLEVDPDSAVTLADELAKTAPRHLNDFLSELDQARPGWSHAYRQLKSKENQYLSMLAEGIAQVKEEEDNKVLVDELMEVERETVEDLSHDPDFAKVWPTMHQILEGMPKLFRNGTDAESQREQTEAAYQLARETVVGRHHAEIKQGLFAEAGTSLEGGFGKDFHDAPDIPPISIREGNFDKKTPQERDDDIRAGIRSSVQGTSLADAVEKLPSLKKAHKDYLAERERGR